MFARPFIDSVEFARNGKELCGEIGLSELSRLDGVLAKNDGTLAYTVRGYRDKDCDMLEVLLRGVCILRCQRCLNELPFEIDLVSRLRLLEADRLDEVEEDDEADNIEATSQLDVLALIEDELLLGLPFAPMHKEGMCASTTDKFQQKASPFAALAGLKK